MRESQNNFAGSHKQNHGYLHAYTTALIFISCVMASCSTGQVLSNARPKAWDIPLIIKSGEVGVQVSSPQIAMDEQGNVLLVWEVFDGTRKQHWLSSSRYSVRGGWHSLDEIVPDTIETAVVGQHPRISSFNNGSAQLIWVKYFEKTSEIRSKEFSMANGWGATLVAHTKQVEIGDSFLPVIAQNYRNTALLVWEQRNSSGYEIVAKRHFPNTNWSKLAYIKNDEEHFASDAKVIFDAKGIGHAVWKQNNGVIYNRYSEKDTPGTGWQNSHQITPGGFEVQFPDIAADQQGNVIAVWLQLDSESHLSKYSKIWASRMTANGVWSTAQAIEDNHGGIAGGPSIAMDEQGNAIVVWDEENGTSVNIWANRFSPNVGWGKAERIDGKAQGLSVDPMLAFDANGNALAVWREADGKRLDLVARHYLRDKGWGPLSIIDNRTAGTVETPQVVVSKEGNALATWCQTEGRNTTIWVNHFH